jgi:hypothetical protein
MKRNRLKILPPCLPAGPLHGEANPVHASAL